LGTEAVVAVTAKSDAPPAKVVRAPLDGARYVGDGDGVGDGVDEGEGVGDGMAAHAADAPACTTRTRPYVGSVTRSSPFAVTATDDGCMSVALSAGPPSPPVPGHVGPAPEPAAVEMTPAGVTRRTRLFLLV
jgi:hypothetical protein